VRLADLRGYSYDRRDVTGRGLANAYAQTLGAVFTEQSKPLEVEICIAEVGESPDKDELYRLTYDGSVGDEPGFVAMGGQSEAIVTALRKGHRADLTLTEALKLAVASLASVGGENGKPRKLSAAQLEVAVLERARPGRAFRRVVGAALERLLADAPPAETVALPAEDAAAPTPSAEPAPSDAEPKTAEPKTAEPKTAERRATKSARPKATDAGQPAEPKDEPPSA
jgi:proteasome alpha subunit